MAAGETLEKRLRAMRRSRAFRVLFRRAPAKLLSLTAAAVIYVFLRVNTLEERFFNTPLEVQLPPGYALASPVPQIVRVTLRGESDAIFALSEDDFRALIDLVGLEQGAFRIPVEIVPTGSAAAVSDLDVSADPGGVEVVLEQSIQRSVEVRARLTGEPARGYELSGFSLSPSVVQIEGPRSRVTGIDAVPTEEIDISGRTDGFVARVRIDRVDPFVRVTGGAIVELRALVRPVMAVRRFERLAVEVAGLDAQLRIEDGLRPVAVAVSGRQPIVEQLRADDVAVQVDLSEAAADGVFDAVLRVELPEGVELLEITPPRLDLIIAPAAGSAGETRP